ncbi:MAG: tRNA preQ1(34) S-adenosylmethionine ribosyltransferase-isomerase QueA [Chloroflexota bacterium]
MKTTDFDYDLPQELIAQTPAEPRDSAKLLILHRDSQRIEHAIFHDIGNYLKKGDILVLNQTRVIPARLFAKKFPTGGKVEILLLRREDEFIWETLIGGKHIKIGQRLYIGDKHKATVINELDGAQRLVRFDQPIDTFLPQIGNIPLPPYITTPISDPSQYQTVYAKDSGSAAAPTAGLHFTQELLDGLKSKGIEIITVTLHIGLDTFLPVNEEYPKDHRIHSEWCEVSSQTIDILNQAKQNGRRVIAVGTTSVRALESAAQMGQNNYGQNFCGQTRLFILPGYHFKMVDGMITNFHLPKSTLIMLVSAFAGRELIMRSYEQAKLNGYHFYSFGDAMLIL